MDNAANNYLNRAKAIMLRTNNIGLVFLFTLTYVWYKSVLPTNDLVTRLVNVKEKTLYFDSVVTEARARDSVKTANLFTLRKKDLVKAFTASSHVARSPYLYNPNRILHADTSFGKTLSRNKERYNEAILPIKKITDSVKAKLTDSLHSAQFEMQVPTLSSIKTDYNIGFPIWMFLSTFFLFYVSVNRNLIFYYLKKSLSLYSRDSTSIKDIIHLDMLLPFWLYPVTFENHVWKGKSLYDALNNSWGGFKTLVTVIMIFFLLYMQFEVVQLSWNINNFAVHYKETLFKRSYTSQVINFSLFAICCVLTIAWFFPYRLNLVNQPKEETDFFRNRRTMLKFSLLGAALFFMQFPPLNGLMPTIKAASFNYRRRRPEKNEVQVTDLSGFYINAGRTKTIHYFSSDHRSLSLKSVPAAKQKAFLNKLQKINILDYANKLKKFEIRFPYSYWALEIEADKMVQSDNAVEALKLLELGVHLNLFDKSGQRLLQKFRKVLKVYDKELNGSERALFTGYLKSFESKRRQLL
jgi:hypothetical protein